jgi:hypothetical protein
MKMYKASKFSWGKKIEVVEVERISDKSVWIKGRRCALDSSYDAYFSELSEAKACLIAIAMREAQSAEDQFKKKKKDLELLLVELDKY